MMRPVATARDRHRRRRRRGGDGHGAQGDGRGGDPRSGALGLRDLPRLHGRLPRVHRARAEDRGHAPPPGDGGEPHPARVPEAVRQPRSQRQPLALPARSRADWAKGLGIPTLAEKPDAEYLFWVGCAGSYDERNVKVSIALARLSKRAGESFAILGTEESLHRRSRCAAPATNICTRCTRSRTSRR